MLSFKSLASLATLLALAAVPRSVEAACECGYFDPNTQATWTDATISYFNESRLTDLVLTPEQSPSIWGADPIGNTGNGTQNWAVVGDYVSNWEDSFGATWRTAGSYNNTFYSDDALAMQVSYPDMKTRVVNGSAVVTRRRDIQYGTFRAMIKTYPIVGTGAGLRFQLGYNDR